MDHSTFAKQAQTQAGVWNLIWRVKVPQKINNFTWKLMHDSLPTLLSLKNRGISTSSTCPLCNEEDESTTHLFLLCPFTRACWHDSTLAIHSSYFSNIFVQHWLTLLLSKYKVRGTNSIVSCRPSSRLYGPFGTIEIGWFIKVWVFFFFLDSTQAQVETRILGLIIVVWWTGFGSPQLSWVDYEPSCAQIMDPTTHTYSYMQVYTYYKENS